jgi:hypothetical protein
MCRLPEAKDDPMTKSAKPAPRSRAKAAAPAPAAAPPPPEAAAPAKLTKQAMLLAMLRSPEGATAEAMSQASGWQMHSVRGFLAGR